MTTEDSCGVIILAAGASRRLGKPKQLLSYQNSTLLQKAIDSADKIELYHKIVVLGAYADDIKKSINTRSFEVLINDAWEEGIASSIRAGLSSMIQDHTSVKSALFLLSDQPYLTADHLNELVSQHQHNEPSITGSFYANQVGVPVIFSHHYFEELLELKGDQGAKKVLMRHMESTQSIPFKNGEIDIDTQEDYEKLV